MVLAALANFFCPGIAQLYISRYRLFLALAVLPFVSIFFITWSGAVFVGAALLNIPLVLMLIHSFAAFTVLKFIPDNGGDRSKTFIRFAKCILWLLLWYAMLIVLFLNKSEWLGFDIYQVASTSMVPTLKHGEFVLADTRHRNFNNNDVVFFHRKFDGKIYVKRILTIGEDVVEGNRNAQVINHDSERMGESLPLTLSNNQVFVIGDNRDASYDSRNYGAIPISAIKARAVKVYRNGKWQGLGD